MKKLAITLSLLTFAVGAFAQGSVQFQNSGTTRFQINGVNAASSSGPFYYEVLTASSTVTSVDSSLQGLLSGSWSDTGLGIAGATGVPGAASTASQLVQHWGIGTAQSFIIVGWSQNLGTSWSTIAAELEGATLTGNTWSGSNFSISGSSPAYLGATTVGWRQAGGIVGSTTIPTPGLFGTAADAQGSPITTPTQLFLVSVPEPTSFALAGLGMGALMIFRRRKA